MHNDYSMLLTIDVGNTRAKLTAFDAQGGVFVDVAMDVATLQHEIQRIVACADVEGCVWCNVGGDDEAVERVLQTYAFPSLKVTGESRVPLRVDYKSRATLGSDRLAAAVGGAMRYPGRNLLIVDAGTCITLDVVTAEGAFLGGNISPGVEMRLQMLHEKTARLPRVVADGDLPELGYNTETAIRCGVVHGVQREVEGYVVHLQQCYADLLVLTTGGGAKELQISNAPCVNDERLVAEGLLRIWQEYVGTKQ